ncbi:MAG TPA: protein kinase, partial [Candidatus Sulfopaludibacter sp.]|nr:protein kinase [Candidatus Sulfopaludibacter sp.]
MVGTSVSHYRVVDKLGSGGMGEVYLAEDEHLRRRVAIKLPDTRHDSPGSRRRFEHEAQVASRLTHPNIARIYDYGEAPDGRPFLVMELVDGKSLRDVLLQGRLQPGRAAVVVAGVLRALEAAHRNGLVHRDIKPANVMLDSSDEVKVLDFGLAKEAPEPAPLPLPEDASLVETVTLSVTLPGMMAGTPAYMPPEQARALRVDARADLFSTGLVLYECLTGIAVFSGRTQREVLDKVCTEDPVPASVRVPELSKAWDRVLARALCKDPAGRYQSAAEMLEDVEALGAPQPGSWTGSVAMALAGTRRRAAVSVIGAMVVLIVALLLTRGMGPHRPSAEAAGWYQRGAMALRDGTYYSAARVLQKAVDLDPDYGLAHARLADAVNELEDGARASAEMLLALAKTKPPGGTAGLYIDAINRTLTGDFTGAAKTYRQLADKAQGSEKAAALVDLARVYDKSQQPAKAIEACRESLANDPQSAAAHLRLGVLLGRAKSPECAQEFDRAFALYQALSNTEGQAEV